MCQIKFEIFFLFLIDYDKVYFGIMEQIIELIHIILIIIITQQLKRRKNKPQRVVWVRVAWIENWFQETKVIIAIALKSTCGFSAFPLHTYKLQPTRKALQQHTKGRCSLCCQSRSPSETLPPSSLPSFSPLNKLCKQHRLWNHFTSTSNLNYLCFVQKGKPLFFFVFFYFFILLFFWAKDFWLL